MGDDTGRWNHNLRYHSVIVSAVPAGCKRALDVGCGQGALTRRLSTLVPHVTGIDRDERSIELALRLRIVRPCHRSRLAAPYGRRGSARADARPAAAGRSPRGCRPCPRRRPQVGVGFALSLPSSTAEQFCTAWAALLLSSGAGRLITKLKIHGPMPSRGSSGASPCERIDEHIEPVEGHAPLSRPAFGTHRRCVVTLRGPPHRSTPGHQPAPTVPEGRCASVQHDPIRGLNNARCTRHHTVQGQRRRRPHRLVHAGHRPYRGGWCGSSSARSASTSAGSLPLRSNSPRGDHTAPTGSPCRGNPARNRCVVSGKPAR